MSQKDASARSWLASQPPGAAVELTATRVAGVALADYGGSRVVTAHAVEPLSPGVLTPGLNAANVHDEGALVSAIRAVLTSLGGRTRKVALVLPDSIAKVSLVRFEKVPAKAADLEQLIRWQMRKAAPFRIEDAQLAYEAGVELPGGGREYLVTVVRRDIVQSYERACEAAGVQAGLIDLASFNQINAVLASGESPGDWLLVNVASDYATLAVVRGGDVVFFRNRSSAGEAELADLVHQTAMYHEDRLGGGGFSRVVLAGLSALGADTERFRLSLEERMGATVEPIDFRPAAELRNRITVSPDLCDILAAPIGILLRERVSRGARVRAAASEVA